MALTYDLLDLPPLEMSQMRKDGYTSLVRHSFGSHRLSSGDQDSLKVGTMLGALNKMFDLARDTSMDVHNDPRFFTKSVLEKRLQAFKSLTIVSSLMFGTALGQLTGSVRNFDFSKKDPIIGNVPVLGWLLGNIGVLELLAFLLAILVASMCMLPLYVLAHQVFYCTRLQTAGPTGFEQSSQFYLTRVIVGWRHLAVSCMFNGLVLFSVLVGLQYFLLFYNDANSAVTKPDQLYVTNLLNGTAVEDRGMKFPEHHKLNMAVATAISYGSVVFIIITSCFLWKVRVDHLNCFKLHYAQACLLSKPLEHTMVDMGNRSGPEPSVN